jgi:hypothetical protein
MSQRIHRDRLFDGGPVVEGDDMANKIRSSVVPVQGQRPSAVQTEKPAAGRFRPEGIALALSGVLFLVQALFDLKVGEPPSAGADLVAWRSAEEFSLSR